MLICTKLWIHIVNLKTRKMLDSPLLFIFLKKLTKIAVKWKWHETSSWSTDLSQASCLRAQTMDTKHTLLAQSFPKFFSPEAGTQVRYAENFLMSQLLAHQAAVFWEIMKFTSFPSYFLLLQKVTREFFCCQRLVCSQRCQGPQGNLVKCYCRATELGTIKSCTENIS